MLKNVKGIGEIIINTDSDRAIKIAKNLKVNFFRRSHTLLVQNAQIVNFGQISRKTLEVSI